MKDVYLIGADKYYNVVYAVIEVREWNNKRTFSVSFNSYEPFNIDEFDFEDYYEMWIDNLGKDYLYDLCFDYDCAPSELVSNLANDAPYIHDLIDTNCEEVKVNGEWWSFEFESGGQYDTTDRMDEFVNKEAYNLIMDLWKNYHLQEATEEVMEKVNKVHALLCDVDEDAWLADYIERVYA